MITPLRGLPGFFEPHQSCRDSEEPVRPELADGLDVECLLQRGGVLLGDARERPRGSIQNVLERLVLVGLIESLSQIDRYDTCPAESPCSYHPTCLTLAGQPGVRECGDSIPDGSLLVSMRGLTTPGAGMTYADADSTRATWGCPHLPDLPGNVAARHRGMHLLFDRENPRESRW